jgi:hypothetical protein
MYIKTVHNKDMTKNLTLQRMQHLNTMLRLPLQVRTRQIFESQIFTSGPRQAASPRPKLKSRRSEEPTDCAMSTCIFQANGTLIIPIHLIRTICDISVTLLSWEYSF